MARTERARWSARFAPLVALFVIAAMFFGPALSSAKPKEAGKSESAPGQTKKDSSDAEQEDAGSEEAAEPAKAKPVKDKPAQPAQPAKPAKEKPAKDTSAKPSKPSSGGNGNGSSGAGSSGGSQGSGSGGGSGSGKGSGAPDGKKNPPGNNGTIKIDALPFDDHPNNEPHVGCIFQIDLYGYDDNDDYYADYSFVLHSPTLSPSGDNGLMNGNVFIGEDAAGGGRDLDASVTIDLSDALAASGATPHARQGYHVKLTVHADGSQGADTKHKVFWVQGCGSTSSSSPPSSQPPSSSQPPGGSQIVSQPPSSEAPQPSVEGSQLFSQEIPPSDAPQPSPGTTILGRRITTGPSSVLPFTGGTVSTLLILAGLLLAAGGSMLLGARKYRPTGSMS